MKLEFNENSVMITSYQVKKVVNDSTTGKVVATEDEK